VGTRLDWTAELECWLEPFLNRLGHKTRRRRCPLYISGLSYDQLHHFVAAGVWDAAPLEAELLGLSGETTLCWSSTTQRCRRRATIPLA
jgi:hypothetical protein